MTSTLRPPFRFFPHLCSMLTSLVPRVSQVAPGTTGRRGKFRPEATKVRWFHVIPKFSLEESCRAWTANFNFSGTPPSFLPPLRLTPAPNPKNQHNRTHNSSELHRLFSLISNTSTHHSTTSTHPYITTVHAQLLSLRQQPQPKQHPHEQQRNHGGKQRREESGEPGQDARCAGRERPQPRPWPWQQ